MGWTMSNVVWRNWLSSIMLLTRLGAGRGCTGRLGLLAGVRARAQKEMEKTCIGRQVAMGCQAKRAATRGGIERWCRHAGVHASSRYSEPILAATASRCTSACSEGGIWATLFGLLLWDVLFMPVPDVFRTPFQVRSAVLCSCICGIYFKNTAALALPMCSGERGGPCLALKVNSLALKHVHVCVCADSAAGSEHRLLLPISQGGLAVAEHIRPQRHSFAQACSPAVEVQVPATGRWCAVSRQMFPPQKGAFVLAGGCGGVPWAGGGRGGASHAASCLGAT